MSLMRLAYASKATFEESPIEQGIEPNVARILMSSRTNNAQSEIVGGLYYGDGRFFQYLEGEEESVRKLYDKISKDQRHTDVTTLLEEPIDERTFASWSMKYVPLSGDVNEFLSRHGMEEFRPENFTRPLCEDMIQLIRDSSEAGRVVSHDGNAVAKRQSVLPTSVLVGLLIGGAGVVAALAYAMSLSQ